jgi:hypothetical protein
LRKNFKTIIVRHRHLIKNTEFPAFKAFIEFKNNEPNLRSVIFLDECSASKRSEIIIELYRYMKGSQVAG